MSSTVLALVQEFTDGMGLPTPSALIGATDKGTAQYRALLKQTVRDLSEYRWQQQKIRGTWLAPGAFSTNAVVSTTLVGITNAWTFAGDTNFGEGYLHGRSAPDGPFADVPGTILVNGVATPVINSFFMTSNIGTGFLVWDSSGAGFALSAFSPRPYVFARYNAGTWEYDFNDQTWVAFTPNSNHYIIGEVATGSLDTGIPGSPPGVTQLTIWETAVSIATPTVAEQDQGNLTALFGANYLSLVTDSIWNTTRRMRVFGPLPDATWQALSVLPNAGPEYQCWIAGNHLYISPAPQPGEEHSAIFWTSAAVVDLNGVPKAAITADTDTLLFPDNVTLSWFKYRWKQQKGVAGWEDDYNDAITLVSRNIVKDGAPTFWLDTSTRSLRPGIVIPAGSWNV
jgi:hypothetical protein